jgi:hypothetical protein
MLCNHPLTGEARKRGYVCQGDRQTGAPGFINLRDDSSETIDFPAFAASRGQDREIRCNPSRTGNGTTEFNGDQSALGKRSEKIWNKAALPDALDKLP